MRRFARRHLPRPLRLAIALLRRAVLDALAGRRFATTREPADAYRHPFEDYTLPLIVYPGQEAVAETKLRNLQLLAESLDGTVVAPGELWSLWRLAGMPSRAKGYGEAAAIINGELTTAVGGATCLASSVIFNAALLAGLDVVERTQHSVDTYGERRYFDLGRDATIEYGYLDLRLANPHPVPVRLSVTVANHEVRARFQSPTPAAFRVAVTVDVDRSNPGMIHARTHRTIQGPAHPSTSSVFESRYRIPGIAEGFRLDAVSRPVHP
jgi:vancomycin resistance protein VanW